MADDSSVQFSDREALLFHSEGRPGKIEIIASKPLTTQRDLALAYSPGVAIPVQAIADDPATAYDYTAKVMVENMLTQDAQEGIGAFLGKRMPEWKGE